MTLRTRVRLYKDGFTVYAHFGALCLGRYDFYLFEEDALVSSELRSYRRKAGVPRILVARAVEEIERLSKQMEKELTHEISIATKRAKKVLPHILTEHGYRIRRPRHEDQLVRLTRTYAP